MKKEKNTDNESWREVSMKGLLERAEPVYDCVKDYVQRTTDREWAITEHILRNFIDHPIKGDITMEAIEKAGVFILSDYHPFQVDSIEPHRFTVSYTDPVFIVVQGNEIIEANGTRKPATKGILEEIEK